MKKSTVILLLFVVFFGSGLFYRALFKEVPADPKSSVSAPQQTTPALIENPNVNSKNVLVLSNKGLTKLPEYVLSQTNLVELDISNNNLSGALPAEIRKLQNLKVLNASNNQMTGVPAEIGQLTNLEVLNLSNNKLTGLPYELGNLKNLRQLNISGNQYSKQDLEVIKKGLSTSVEIIL